MSKKRLHLKIRVVAEERMTVGELRAKVRRTVRTGIVQRGIRLAWIDWRKPGSATVAKGGTYLGEEAVEALREFYGAIHHEDTRTRFEVIHEG